MKKLTSTQGEIAQHRQGGGGFEFGQFDDMCIKPTPTKCVALNFGFHFWCLGFIFDFHKVNVIYYYYLKILKNLNNYIQGIMITFMVYTN
jgi:hypothetical protein